MSIQTAETIDVHAHAVLDETMNTAGHYGPELTAEEPPRFRVGDYELIGVRYRGSPFMDPDLRIAAMDQLGIDYQVLSPNPLTYFHWIEPEHAGEFCRTHNDVLAAIAERYPDRLGAMAAIPIQDIGMAIEETERAVTELGMYAPYIGTDFRRSLAAPEMDEFYATLTRLDVPLFIHPAPAGIDGPAGDANLRPFDLDVIAGFCGQETIAVATLIYGGVLERHPDLTSASATAAVPWHCFMAGWQQPPENVPGPARACARMAPLTPCCTDSGLMSTCIPRTQWNC